MFVKMLGKLLLVAMTELLETAAAVAHPPGQNGCVPSAVSALLLLLTQLARVLLKSTHALMSVTAACIGDLQSLGDAGERGGAGHHRAGRACRYVPGLHERGNQGGTQRYTKAAG